MNRIDALFASTAGKRSALIGYTTAGFPDLEGSLAIAAALLQNCDALELGVPFSDPIMDGPIIQEASRLALEAGVRAADAIALAGRLRERTAKPIMIMTYYNPVLRFGLDEFAHALSEAGADGVLIPDLPLEETAGWRCRAEARGLHTVLFASSTTGKERMQRIARATTGFLYCLAANATTGLRESLPESLPGLMAKARECCRVPLAVGVGISNAGQCREAGKMADGVIVGSAFVKEALEAWRTGAEPGQAVAAVSAGFKRALADEDP